MLWWQGAKLITEDQIKTKSLKMNERIFALRTILYPPQTWRKNLLKIVLQHFRCSTIWLMFWCLLVLKLLLQQIVFRIDLFQKFIRSDVSSNRKIYYVLRVCTFLGSSNTIDGIDFCNESMQWILYYLLKHDVTVARVHTQ